MGEDIFRSPLRDEETKELVYGYPKFRAVNYQPSPLNETAPTIVKKFDGLLHDQLRWKMIVNSENDEDIIVLDVENIHKSLEFPGKALQMVESTSKPIYKDEKFESLLAAKKPQNKPRSARNRPFCQIQQPAFGYTPATAPIQQATQSAP
ncbi:hypothetical protein AYI70_g3960 [Smittium culicis]|uniref:Uncharacterized protein n=1 Tax=Smittium culicis TaxID=133412 RepID=A0A1R1Y1A6_9FUNG|nr:hypothetical protein AYI70_g3960 [Smittium culicis]